MAIQLLEAVQEKLQFPPLHKIDVTTDQVKDTESNTTENAFAQAAIPAVLTALVHYAQSDTGAAALLANNNNGNWLDELFVDHKESVIHTIADYAQQSPVVTAVKLNIIATEAIAIATNQLPPDAGIAEVKQFFEAQKNDIVLYLPPSLQIGKYLNNNSIDDGTTKMEGPMSSLITSIGNIFSSPASDEEIKKD
jgi:hypothetical protein